MTALRETRVDILDTPKRAKFTRAPEQRYGRDETTAPPRPRTVTDAFQRVFDALERVDASLDRAIKRIEENRRADRIRKLEAMFADRPITGRLLEGTFQKPWKWKP